MTGKFTGRRSQFPRQTSTSVPYPDLEIRGGGGAGGHPDPRPLDKGGGRSLGLKIGGPPLDRHCTVRVRHLSEIACYLKILSHECRTLNLTNSQTGRSCSKVDNALHWINLYPVDNAVGFPDTNQLNSNSSDSMLSDV